MKQNNNIGDDSQWTIEQDNDVEEASKIPRPTIEFRNTMISNKGDISTARKISNMETIVNWKDVQQESQSSHYSLSVSSNSVSSVNDSQDKQSITEVFQKSIDNRLKEEA